MSNRRVTFLVGANVAEFERKMKQVERRFQTVGRQATFLGRDLRTSITAPVLAAGAGILALAHNTAQYADRVSDLSDVTGISTDAIQEWDFVAKRVGVSTDVLSSAFSSLGRRMSQFQRGSGPAVNAAKELGVEFRNTDGSMRNADDLIMEIMGKLNRMPADLDRARIGTELFGRRWEMLAPIIGRGSDEIERIRDQAREMGLVMDGEALEGANRFREEMVNFQEQMSSTGRTIAMQFMPTILEFLPLAEQLVFRIGETVQKFAELDKEVQIQTIRWAAYAAAIGPALILLGSVITSAGKILGIFRSLALLAAKNPLVAIAAGATVLAVQQARAANETQRLREEMEKLTSQDAQSSDLQRLNQLIIEQGNAIEMAERNFNRMGSSSRAATQAQIAQIEEMKDTLDELIRKRDEAAAVQLDEIISSKAVDNAEAVAEAMERVAAAVGITRLQIEAPESLIFDPTDEIAQLLSDEFITKQGELWRSMIDNAGDYSHRLSDIQQETKTVHTDFSEFAHLGIQAFDRLIFQGERFSQTLRSIGRQLAMRGLFTLLTGGFGGGMGAGIGAMLGVTRSVNDAVISPRGDIISTHPDDYLIATKNPGKMASNIHQAGSGKATVIENVIVLDGRVLYRSMKDVEYGRR